MAKSIAAAPLIALFIACSPAQYPENPVHVEYEVVIDADSFAPSETQTVARGLGDWEVATDNLNFKIYEAPCDQFRPAQSICVEAIHHPCGHDDYVGCWSTESRHIGIDKYRLSRNELRLVTAHEIGHALGLEHDKTGTAMAFRVDLQTPPTCRDVEKFWKQYDVRGSCRL